MPRLKTSAKRKIRSKAVPVLGVAGMALLAGASAAFAHPALEQTADTSDNKIVLGEEEIADVSLATFYAIDHEGQGQGQRRTQRIRMAMGGACGCGCGACGGCWGGSYVPPGPRPIFGVYAPFEPVRPVQKYRHTYKRTDNR